MSRSALLQLQQLFDEQSTWAQGRTLPALRRMLASSSAVVSAWEGQRLAGFGRASSDGRFRAVLWDVIVDQRLHNRGIGRQIVENLMTHPSLALVERVYLMTSNSANFYSRLGFRVCTSQQLMWLERHQS